MSIQLQGGQNKYIIEKQVSLIDIVVVVTRFTDYGNPWTNHLSHMMPNQMRVCRFNSQ